MAHRKTEVEIRALAERTWSAREARIVLREQERSGLSIHAFAREYGLSHERLYRWNRKLEPSNERSLDVEFAGIEFTPVVLANERAPAVTVRVDGVELEVSDPASVEPSWLAAVIASVRSR